MIRFLISRLEFLVPLLATGCLQNAPSEQWSAGVLPDGVNFLLGDDRGESVSPFCSATHVGSDGRHSLFATSRACAVVPAENVALLELESPGGELEFESQGAAWVGLRGASPPYIGRDIAFLMTEGPVEGSVAPKKTSLPDSGNSVETDIIHWSSASPETAAVETKAFSLTAGPAGIFQGGAQPVGAEELYWTEATEGYGSGLSFETDRGAAVLDGGEVLGFVSRPFLASYLPNETGSEVVGVIASTLGGFCPQIESTSTALVVANELNGGAEMSGDTLSAAIALTEGVCR